MLKRIRDQIGSLPLSRKLALMALFLVAPTLAVGLLFYHAQNVQLVAAGRQWQALQFSRPLVRLQLKLAIHRDAAAMALAAAGGGSEAVRAAQVEVDAAVLAAQSADAEFGESFGTHTLLTELIEAWSSNVKPNWNTSNPTLSFDMHTLALALVTDMLRLVGQNARMEFGLEQRAGRLDRALVFSVPVSVSRQPALTPEQWDQMAVLMQDVRRGNEALRSAVSRAAKHPEFDKRLKTAADQAVTSSEGYLETVQDAGLRRNRLQIEPHSYRAQADQAVAALTGLQVLLTETGENELEAGLAGLKSARNFELIGVGSLVALALWLGYLIANTVRRQVASMASVFQRIRDGDLGARAEVTARDELGSFARALNLVLDNTVALVQSRQERDKIQAGIRKLLSEIEGVAQGDLSKEAEASEEMTGPIAESFNVMLVELRGLIRRVQESTLAVNAAATGAQDATLGLADGSQAQAAQIIHASAAVDQMTLSIQQVTAQAATAARIAQDALRNAQLGAHSAKETIDGMGLVKQQVSEMSILVRELGESSVQIGDITQLIADISKRTSVLALNASIQAAVAGQSGKGFGVVAEQVEELATRSSDAVRRVAQLTKAIQASTAGVNEALGNATRQAVGGEMLATEASRRLADIETVSRQLAGVVESILTACRQQSASSESIAQSMGEISRVTKRTSAGAQHAASSIQGLSDLVAELRGSVSRFRLPTTPA
jgi:methyl-accepting chemotaxis protein